MSEQLRHKIVNFEVAPPSTAWDSIAERLDDDRQYAVVAAKMTGAELAPPPMAWNSISAALDETAEVAPVIPIRRTPYKLLAAAAIIGIVAVAGWLLLNNNPAADLAVNSPSKNENSPAMPAPVPQSVINDHMSVKNQELKGAAQAPAAPVVTGRTAKTPTHTYQEDDRILKYAVLSSVPSFPEMPIVISSAPITDKNGVVIRDMDVLTTSNYIMVTGPNGQLTRISSKFASVIRYLNGDPNDTEEYIDRVIKESDTWKKRFQEWRSKISQSSFIPSSANFLDIIEFKDLIEEKK
jgi:hypothetical protein